MDFLLDQNVARSVATVLTELGHACQYSRELLPADAADPVVAVAAEQTGAILVTHDRDFKTIAPRVQHGQRARFKRLSRIALECSEVEAAGRIRELMPVIEALWALAQSKPDKRLILHITKTSVRTI